MHSQMLLFMQHTAFFPLLVLTEQYSKNLLFARRLPNLDRASVRKQAAAAPRR